MPAASDAALAPAAASAPAGARSSSQCLSLNYEFRHVHGAILNPHVPMSQIINDYRYIVKTLICGVKTLTWAMTSGSGGLSIRLSVSHFMSVCLSVSHSVLVHMSVFLPAWPPVISVFFVTVLLATMTAIGRNVVFQTVFMLIFNKQSFKLCSTCWCMYIEETGFKHQILSNKIHKEITCYQVASEPGLPILACFSG